MLELPLETVTKPLTAVAAYACVKGSTTNGYAHGDERCPRGRTGAGRRHGHLPRGEHDLHRSGEYDLTNTQYGAMFLPQAVLAIACALLGAGFASRLGVKRVYVVGLAAGLISMVLLVTSNLFTANFALAYPLLLVA